ncbi:hypothetical protein [Streptomyces sp. SID13031]|uniref:hypothetical protein n=1 Tax=Streptomyces sp. SID13031 TaxID=2706046 RepID=UPI0013C7CCD2|nr:hypothetical protein [Streptomyces sp. SID13031]NEA34382.1 hypothetical protein [Streptomyces sp. SID13031]
MNLRVRVVHCACAGEHHWYADIDDTDDPQPDDPYWFVDRCGSQSEALELACAQLLELSGEVLEADSLTRVQEARLVRV